MTPNDLRQYMDEHGGQLPSDPIDETEIMFWIKCSECGIEMGEVVSQEEWDKLKGENK